MNSAFPKAWADSLVLHILESPMVKLGGNDSLFKHIYGGKKKKKKVCEKSSSDQRLCYL